MRERPEAWSEQNADRFTLIAMTVGGLIFGAIFGAIFLPILYGFVASFLDWNAKVPHLRWAFALGGAGFSGFRAYLRGRKQIRRRQATRGVAEDLGMQYSADASEELRDELGTLFGDRGGIRVSNTVHREVDSARIVVADMQYRHSSGSNSDTKVTNQTIAYFTADQLQFPRLELQPEGVLLTLMTSLLGDNDIDFDDYPEFSKQYHLTGVNPQMVRQLFGRELLEHFTRNPGWQVKADGKRLLLFRPRKRFDPSHLEGFIDEAMETFSHFMTASYDLADATSTASSGVPSSDGSLGDAGVMPSLLAAAIERSRVTPAELERFLTAPTPRDVPLNIRRQRLGGGSLVASILGCLFLTAGVVMAAVAIFVLEGPMTEDRVVVSIFGTLLPLVGGVMAYFAIRYRYQNSRLLRHGSVAEGHIEAVQRTDTTINNQRQYKLKVRFSDQLGRRTSTCNIYGKVAEAARQRHQEGQPVRILYDRSAPQRILWADAFTLAKF